MAKRRCLAIGLVACLAGTASADSDFLRWFNANFADRVNISGYRRLGYHLHTVEGDREAFNLSNYYGLGDEKFTDIGSMYISGRKVLGVLNFDFTIQDDRFEDPLGNRFSMDYDKGNWKVNLGDIQGSLLNTNRFARFNKTLRGGSLLYHDGALQAKLLHSEVKGEPRTVSIPGANSSGPYYLQGTQIIQGTESITVDGVQQQFGTDYTMDYDLGSVTFINRQTLEGKIIPPTSTIVATYEAYGFSGTKGTLMGAGLSYDMGRGGRIGVSAMQQKSGGNSSLSSRLEKFQGFGPPSVPYVLQFEPLLTQPIVIRVDGVLQVRDVDWRLDPDNPSIFYFNRFVPSTSTVDVLYTPKPTSTVNGDREIIGLDYRLPFGDKGSKGFLLLSQATGRLSNTALPQKGTARSAELVYREGKVELSAGIRDVPTNYISIESVGFSRNERASDFRATYQQSPKYTFSLSHLNSAIANRQVTSGGDVVFIPSRFTLSSASVGFTPLAGGSPWSLSHTSTRSRRLNTGETKLENTSFTTSKNLGRLTASLDLQNQFVDGPITVAGAVEDRQAHIMGLQLRTRYSAGEEWAFNLSGGVNRIAVAGETGFGRDVQFGATYSPNEEFSSNLVYTDSKAGKMSELGINTGYGYGYDGNSFSGGTGGNPLTGTADFRRLSINNNWRPNDRMSVGLGANLYRTEGTVSSNSETSSVLLGFDYDLGRNTRLNSTIGMDDTRYLEQDLRSRATTASFGLDGSPPGRFSYSLNGTFLFTSGSSFAQDTSFFDLNLNYFLGGRHALSFLYTDGRITGYLPQKTREATLTYKYQVWKSLAFNIHYRWRDVVNQDPTLTSGAYNSRGFDFELAFNFGM